ncbi:DUF5682 family protein [Actinomadura fibrosa]|uniref:DUF5682 family protein n=1 Tax=Actinomadura fibrosa TaxID=111802 RepID=A0ABW2XGF2_9ACTN|nr:DUF5682 family protein [Actinomadura fibrosa]
MSRVEVYGIRHHGPGSARALRTALEDFKPDAVLIEGPPEADPIVELAADDGMVPPVALLAYSPGQAAPDGTGRSAAFWPFAEFSPEWQAIRYALGAGASVRFCDLPAANQLVPPTSDAPDTPSAPDVSDAPGAPEAPDASDIPSAPEAPGAPDAPSAPSAPDAADAADAAEDTPSPTSDAPDAVEGTPGPTPGDREGAEESIRQDPLGWLARAAGYDDTERWWDDVVEHRTGGPSPFPAIAEAMTELRAQLRLEEDGAPSGEALREEQREAHMRRTLRRALKDGYERVAVVVGAWHVPALLAKTPAAHDDRTLRGLPKTKVAMTWVPWTHGRLAGRSGYGAGVRSPGWYHHLFTAPDRPIERWLTDAARVLREEDLHVSSAHVIEAVRLAETLAALRGRPLAGLDEVTEATRAVLCEGADLPVELIRKRMAVGERLGAVPERTPMVPLQRDLQAEQRRLRLKPSALEKEQDLDLRKPTDLERSHLLHRLRLLDVDWGVPAETGRSKGTFRETWDLLWRPEFDVELIEASAWGTTVRGAATARAEALAAEAESLADLTSAAERCLLADLGGALPAVMGALADRAAVDTDVGHLMSALPALVRALRYGDVRGTSTGPLRTVVDGLVVRVCVGLPPAVSGLDDDAARDVLTRVDAVHGALSLLADEGHIERWRRTLEGLIARPDGLHGLLEGRLTRLLMDAGRLDDVPARMARAVSTGTAPDRAAAWVEGFLSGGGLMLMHDEALLRLVDAWISGLPAGSFTDVLPLLRRTFGAYAAAERRAIGERVRRLGTAPAPRPSTENLDTTRAAPATTTALQILGWTPHDLKQEAADHDEPGRGDADHDEPGRGDAGRGETKRAMAGRDGIGDDEAGRDRTGHDEARQAEAGHDEAGHDEAGRGEANGDRGGRDWTARGETGRDGSGRGEAQGGGTGRDEEVGLGEGDGRG